MGVPYATPAPPDYVAEFEAAKREAKEAGAVETYNWLVMMEGLSRDGTLAKTPPVREQLRVHFERLGL